MMILILMVKVPEMMRVTNGDCGNDSAYNDGL